jgi:Rhodopirellula transposase DDE domain
MADKFLLTILGTLNEAQARWYVAREAIALGRGGIKAMQDLTRLSKPTILRGIRELKTKDLPPTDRVRRSGGGRKRLEQSDPALTAALRQIMETNTAGDPMSLLRWTNKSTTAIAQELVRQGHPVSHETVRQRLLELDYSLQANRKNKDGLSPPERDAQFRYINRQVRRFLGRGEPVISVDTKKKERVGNFKNAGKTWRPKGQPLEVESHDFPHLGRGTAIPHGTLDVERNEGFVNVGVSHDTAEFAVESVRRWWKLQGRRHYPKAKAVLICADSGGSNASRSRGWKFHLQQFANEFGLAVTVCHYPPGTSKWNKIEHRMFSFISLNWQGQPLISYQTVVNLIAGTRTRSGLCIKAKLDQREYQKGIPITMEQMKSVNLQPHKTHPQWNYTIS